jgi:hypothetical protein
LVPAWGEREGLEKPLAKLDEGLLSHDAAVLVLELLAVLLLVVGLIAVVIVLVQQLVCPMLWFE